MTAPVEAKCLSGLSMVRHGFFTRSGGVSEGLFASLNCGFGSGDDQEAVRENRARVARRLGAASGVVATPYQVHSTTTCLVEGAAGPQAAPKADALVTRTRGLAIGVLTADCAPVLLADPQASIVAAVHAGWRGAVAGVVESAVAAMESLGAERRRLRAAVGPCINQEAYEVGPEFEAELIGRDPANRLFFVPGRARVHFDLPGFVTHALARAGVRDIERHTLCTFEDDAAFFSYRRATHRGEGAYGRQISAILVV